MMVFYDESTYTLKDSLYIETGPKVQVLDVDGISDDHLLLFWPSHAETKIFQEN